MTLRRTLTGLALGVMALALFMGCVETGPPPPMVMETPPPPPMPEPQLYFVNVSSLALREGPTTAAPQVGTLNFNDEVEILETSSGWARVVMCAAIAPAGPPCATCNPYRLTGRGPCPGSARRRPPRNRPSPPQPPGPCRSVFGFRFFV